MANPRREEKSTHNVEGAVQRTSEKTIDQTNFLAGVDDAHFYRADDIEEAASRIPQDAFPILLSHTPEVYDRAARAGFDIMLSGHTYGGQLCLPGGIPIKVGRQIASDHGRLRLALR